MRLLIWIFYLVSVEGGFSCTDSLRNLFRLFLINQQFGHGSVLSYYKMLLQVVLGETLE